MAQKWPQADTGELVEAIEALGYPGEFGLALAQLLEGPGSIGRMVSYLRSADPKSPEEIADEALAIVEDRRRWAERKMSEHSSETLNGFYSRERDPEE